MNSLPLIYRKLAALGYKPGDYDAVNKAISEYKRTGVIPKPV
jgi:hypothetical protein